MDLGSFLKSECRFGDFKWDYTFYSALRGLASALCSIHNLHLKKNDCGLDYDAIGYHHDLRPANVLISQETFILADFGLGNLKSANVPSQTQWKIGNGDYLTPECMNENFVHQDVGRTIDVWAFGCLIIEVATYMHSGAEGLEKFRNTRMSVGRHACWEESCFYDKNGNVKPTVHQWLATLTRDLLSTAPITSLIKLSRKALKMDSKERPKITDICAELSIISLRAHFVAALAAFGNFMEQSTTMGMERKSEKMKLWFEMERLKAFGQILGLDSKRIASIPSGDLNDRYHEYLRLLTALLRKLQPQSALSDSDALQGSDDTTENSICVNRSLQDDACALNDCLWDLLPPKERTRAETVWLRAMLDTDNVSWLEEVERTFKFEEDDLLYEKGAAMAMIKKIGLEMDSNPTNLPKGFVISKQDIQNEKYVSGHSLAIFRNKVRVLVERMSYFSKLGNGLARTTHYCDGPQGSRLQRENQTCSPYADAGLHWYL
jgi:serine/threonine protein kinase